MSVSETDGTQVGEMEKEEEPQTEDPFEVKFIKKKDFVDDSLMFNCLKEFYSNKIILRE